MIMGGCEDSVGDRIISDCWIHDLTTMKWKKVIVLYMCIRYCMFGFGLQLPLPDTVTERMWHSLSAIQLSPHNVLLVAFGGHRHKGRSQKERNSEAVILGTSHEIF